MTRCIRSTRHFLAHVQFSIIWLVMVLKISDYWIYEGGSEFLPENWIYYSQLIDQKFLKLFISTGLGCSIFIGYTMFLKRHYSKWNIALSILWVVMLPSSFFPGTVAISCCLCAVASAQIISGLLQKKRSHIYGKGQTISLEEKDPITSALTVNPPCGLDLSKLDLGTSKRVATPSISPSVQSAGFIKPRPLISPSRFSSSSIMSSPGNLTKASWVAGGYWQSNNWSSPSFCSPSPSLNTPLTRSSSQSSGFGSVQTGYLNRSPPDSRPDSTLEEIDRLSVFSDNLDSRFCDSNLRFLESSSPSVCQYTNDRTRKSIVSSISAGSDSTQQVVSSHNQWSWLPFMFGFSLALNVCLLSCFAFSYFHLTENALKLHS